MVPNMTDTVDLTKSPLYKVMQVEKNLSLEGNEEQGWYRYVLENGRGATIVGQRRGTLKDVTAYATQYIEQLNQRMTMTKSIWSPRGKKPAAAVESKKTPK